MLGLPNSTEKLIKVKVFRVLSISFERENADCLTLGLILDRIESIPTNVQR